MHRVAIIFGVLLALFSAFIVIAAFFDLQNPAEVEETGAGVLWGLIVFFLGVGASGAYMAVHFWNFGHLKIAEKYEQSLLSVLSAKQGRVTAMEVAAESALSLRESEQALRAFVRAGRGEVQLTADGQRVYYIKGFLSAHDKAQARNPLAY